MARNTLEWLVETLRRGVLSVVCAPRGAGVEVHDVVIHDASDEVEVEIARGDLVLGVGLGLGPSTFELIGHLGDKNASGLVLKAPAAHDSELIEASEGAGLALLSVPAGASWAQIVQLVGSVLSQGPNAAEDMRGLAAGDLFALADAIAELIDAPVTIEDRLSRVLAYSGRQDEADAARAETIVGRRVPERLQERLASDGFFKRLNEERGCVYIDIGEDTLPRLAVAIRAGDELLGSIWAAVQKRPSPDIERTFAETAKVAALHLLRHRAGADVERSLQADLLASILEGTAGAPEAAFRLGLTSASYRVLALWFSDEDETTEARAREQLRDVLALHLSSFRVRGAAVVLGGIVYALAATDDDPLASQELALRIGNDLIERPAQLSIAAIGVGGHARTLGEVPRSKREAEEALRVLRSDPSKVVASIDQVRLQALLARFADAAAAERGMYDHKLRPLIEADLSGGASYIEALTAYFEEFGDYTAAAKRLHIHANTLRYRLRKAEDLSGIRLDDPDERLALMLLLRLLPG